MRLRFVAPLIASTTLAACGGGSSGTHAGSSTEAAGPSPAALCARIPTKNVQSIVAAADPNPAPALRRSAGGTSRLLQCHFTAQAVKVGLTLDRAQNNRQRFDNRITETTQFSNLTPSTLPRPVRGVGDPRTGDEGAQWIPAVDQLLAYRPGAYLIVDFTAGKAADSANRDGAAALARLAFPLLPRGHGINRRVQRPTG